MVRNQTPPIAHRSIMRLGIVLLADNGDLNRFEMRIDINYIYSAPLPFFDPH
ncbi:MAG TPA: hypothetical protein VFC05_11730 [Nitrososphaeraceae archaeon]|nr:hypothetical protein [Nitrososphaeraceae archaeon]